MTSKMIGMFVVVCCLSTSVFCMNPDDEELADALAELTVHRAGKQPVTAAFASVVQHSSPQDGQITQMFDALSVQEPPSVDQPRARGMADARSALTWYPQTGRGQGQEFLFEQLEFGDLQQKMLCEFIAAFGLNYLNQGGVQPPWCHAAHIDPTEPPGRIMVNCQEVVNADRISLLPYLLDGNEHEKAAQLRYFCAQMGAKNLFITLPSAQSQFRHWLDGPQRALQEQHEAEQTAAHMQ